MPRCRSSWATWRTWPGRMSTWPQDLQAKAAALPALYADYRNGFYDTVRRLKNDPTLTPQQANVLMAKYKADIPVLEADMAAVAEAGDRMVQQVSARAIQRAQDARMVIARGGVGRPRTGRAVGRSSLPFHLPGHLPGRGAPHVPPGMRGAGR